MSTDWGTIPAWVGAVGTVTGFGSAIILYQLTHRRSLEADARAVYAEFLQAESKAVLVNAGTRPVLDVAVYFLQPKRELEGTPVHLLAGEKTEFKVDASDQRSYTLRIEFMDTYGTLWQRTGAEQLRRMKRPKKILKLLRHP